MRRVANIQLLSCRYDDNINETPRDPKKFLLMFLFDNKNVNKLFRFLSRRLENFLMVNDERENCLRSNGFEVEIKYFSEVKFVFTK